MPDPTGRWLNARQWQCPKCAWVNDSDREACQQCGGSVRPSREEPVRRWDPLDLVGHDETRVDTGAVDLATKALHTLTRVTRDRAMALIGDGLRAGLGKRGEQGHRAWQAINELPDDGQHAALGSAVDHLEEGGFALYRIDANEPE